MSYVLDHPMIVTSFSEEQLKEAHAKAEEIFSPSLPPTGTAGITVTQIYVTPVNSAAIFFVVPDGSNAGWIPSKEGKRRRNDFIAWLQEADPRYPEERKRMVNWCEVQMGSWDFGDGAYVTRSECGVGKDAYVGERLS